MALVLVDLDAFGRVNKDFDHTVGDRLIERVGAAIRSALRAEDVAGRLGGDEFGAILPYTGRIDAAHAGPPAPRRDPLRLRRGTGLPSGLGVRATSASRRSTGPTSDPARSSAPRRDRAPRGETARRRPRRLLRSLARPSPG
jgi:GGDEF domain-containing protein